MTGASRYFWLVFVILAGSLVPFADSAWAHAESPRSTVEDLLAADSAFSSAASQTDTVSGIAAMFADDIVMPLPGATFARGRDQVVAALRSNPFNLASTARWTPIRGGISADGQHGFTFGFMTLQGSDGSQRLAKYLSYWVRQAGGWRVAAYKRAPRPEGEISLSPLEPALPEAIIAVEADADALRRHRQSLDLAERRFSDDAQRFGLRDAFQRNGSSDAMVMGSGAGFAIGLAAIGSESVANLPSRPPLSPVSWAPDDLLVASSGDLGVTWGTSHATAPVTDGRPETQVFMTIWRRTSVDGQWRYIAE